MEKGFFFHQGLQHQKKDLPFGTAGGYHEEITTYHIRLGLPHTFSEWFKQTESHPDPEKKY